MAHEIIALNGTYNNGSDMAAMRVPSTNDSKYITAHTISLQQVKFYY